MKVLRRSRAPTPAPSPSTSSPIVRRTRSAPPKLTIVPTQAPEAQEEERSRSSETDYAAITARYMARVKNPMTAIRARCIQCTNGQISEVKLCPSTECALHPFRMGKNPHNLKTRKRLAAEAGITLEEYDRQNGFDGSEDDEDDAE